MGAFFQELAPEIKVTVDENSERHSMTTTYIYKMNLGVYLTYNMRHALTVFAQTWKNLTLVLENSWNLKKSAFCPGIVLESSLKYELVFEKYKKIYNKSFQIYGMRNKTA